MNLVAKEEIVSVWVWQMPVKHEVTYIQTPKVKSGN